ncbi:MAG: AAA family ATPase [Planctomycetota bacterium]|nr:AAA family ATPase [Planctomycetota bacterium]
MYLKRLEAQGFKAFADKVVFEFSPGVTCIVGPNGCGKSNIVDATKWVLGEQSAKSLRAGEMQDVIFNGSLRRKPMSFAEVSLTFDNSDRRLPVECAEVTVTRRLTRDGTSEYFINRAPCRLRDIREMFLDTGIGTKSYSIIEQGQVDMLVKANAYERRTIFEEAAGIHGYLARKKQAMSSLERVAANLERLGDILNVTERELRRVANHAAKARRFKKIDDKLRELKKRLLWLRCERLDRALKEAKKAYEEAEAQLSELSAGLSGAQRAQSEFDAEAVRFEETLADMSGRLAAARSAVERLQSDIREAEARREGMAQRAGEAERTGREAAAEAEKYEREAAAVCARINAWVREETALAAEGRRAAIALEEARGRIAVIRSRLAEREAGRFELLQKATEASNARSALEREAQGLGFRRNRLIEELNGAEARRRAIAAERDAASARAGARAAEMAAAGEGIAATERELRECAREMDDISAAVARMREEAAAARSRLEFLRELAGRGEGVAPGALRLLEMLREAPGDAGAAGAAGAAKETPGSAERSEAGTAGSGANPTPCGVADAWWDRLDETEWFVLLDDWDIPAEPAGTSPRAAHQTGAPGEAGAWAGSKVGAGVGAGAGIGAEVDAEARCGTGAEAEARADVRTVSEAESVAGAGAVEASPEVPSASRDTAGTAAHGVAGPGAPETSAAGTPVVTAPGRPRLIGMLADLVEVDAGYAAAVEMALGDRIQALVAQTGDDALAALNILKTGGIGRAGTLALDTLREPAEVPGHVCAMPGFVAQADSLVRCPDRIRPAIRALLRGTAVFDSLPNALAAWKAGSNGTRLVTLEGDVVEPSGFAAGGSLNAGEATLLGRRNEIARLEAELAGVESRIASESGRAEECRRRCTDLAARIETLKVEREKARDAMTADLGAAAGCEREIAEADRRIEALRSELLAVESEVSRVAAALREAEARVADTERAAEELDRSILDDRKALEALERECSGLEAGTADVRLRLTALSERIDAAAAEAARIEAAGAVRRAEAESRLKDAADHAAAREELLRKIEADRQALEKAAAEAESLATEEEKLRNEKSGLRERLAAEKERERQLRLRLDGAQEQFINLQRDLTYAQINMQNAVEKLKTEFQIEYMSAAEKPAGGSGEGEGSAPAAEGRAAGAETAAPPGKDAGGGPQIAVPPGGGAETPDGNAAPARCAAEPGAGDGKKGQTESDRGASGSAGEGDGDEPDSPALTATELAMSEEELEAKIASLEEKLARIGQVSMIAIQEQNELEERRKFLFEQKKDLERARDSLRELINKLNRRSRAMFEETFAKIRENFEATFRKAFGGGKAEIKLEEGKDVLEAGIEIIAKPPGKEPRSITLLSGGEKAMVAIALLFAVYRSRPAPFCMLDEADAPLDEANVDRYNLLIQEFSSQSQFLIVSHNKKTMSYAERIYGVTQVDGVSVKYSLRYSDISEDGKFDEAAVAAREKAGAARQEAEAEPMELRKADPPRIPPPPSAGIPKEEPAAGPAAETGSKAAGA